MIGNIERGEAQPTAALLGRLSAALGMTLSEFVARAEGDDQRLVRVADQWPRWTCHWSMGIGRVRAGGLRTAPELGEKQQGVPSGGDRWRW